ncbi:MAG TPA: hypothetical protein PJ994_05985 [Tepidiformaceae bacterium]|nr:hypothetical protein [Tepidiformaceae bacterium]HMO96648.1 hypothetical protein [Tepidiformaceae bacterium]
MDSKLEALAELDAGYAKFRAPIADLDDSAFSEVWLGTWSLSECLAHMAGWYREMTGAFDRLARGEAPVPPGANYNDTETWNARFAANAKEGREALADWETAYAGYREAAGALSEEFFGFDTEKNRPRIGNRLLQGAGIGHFEEHQPELDRWLASRT